MADDRAPAFDFARDGWAASQWFNSEAPPTLAGLKGKVVVLHTFQMLCPGCVAHGLPQAQKVHRLFPRAHVEVIGLHTVFEHHEAMVPIALKAFIHENRLAFPIGVGLIFKFLGGTDEHLGAEAVAGFLMISTVVGILMAGFLNNGGGAWDNAKKYIESGHLTDEKGKVLGKKTDAHAAAVVGDTVGDPFKDTAGPSLHVLVKLLATITLVLAPLFIR